MTVLVTGAAGFIGYHLAFRLLSEGFPVVCIDNLNSYYDQSLKVARLTRLEALSSELCIPFTHIKADLEDCQAVKDIFALHRPTKVVNLAAQAGVRFSIDNPATYIQANMVGFGNILEGCRSVGVQHLVYASSSSVYGGNTSLPFAESDSVDHPVSLYAATKKANELMAHSYSHLYSLPVTGLRFFTVYGPWGRPDMALFLFTKGILEQRPIQVFNNGQMVRDFTYIDDVIESIFRLLGKPPIPEPLFDTANPNPSKSWAPYRVFNVGNSNPIPLMEYIYELEQALGINAIKEFLPMQQGDVPATCADTSELESWIGYRPKTTAKEGIGKFVAWYRQFYMPHAD